MHQKVSTKGLGCVFWPDAEWLDSWGPVSKPLRAWHIDSDKTQACAEVSIQSGNLFQSLVLISEDASKVSTKGLGCVFWPDAEWLDSQGPWCNLFLAPGIILKGSPACMRSNRRDITLCVPFDRSRTNARCWKGCLRRCLVEFDACVHSLRSWFCLWSLSFLGMGRRGTYFHLFIGSLWRAWKRYGKGGGERRANWDGTHLELFIIYASRANHG